MSGIDPTLLPALDAITRVLEDAKVSRFKRQCERDQQLRDELAERDEEAQRAMGGQDYDVWAELNMGANDDRR